jgi:predicted DsbA family dithiol-disulfide isomerase
MRVELMQRNGKRDVLVPFGIVLATVLLAVGLWASPARAIRWSRVMGCNTSSLSAKEKSRAAKLMRSIHCYYGCSDTIAKCLKKDPKCQTARRVAGMICRMVNHGRSDSVIRKQVMYRARSMHPFKKRKIKLHRSHCTMDPKKAKVVVTAFSDFQCPYCTIILPFLKKVALASKHKVALCFKHFPTQMHGPNAVASARAAVAAAKQGKFYEMFDILYKHRKDQSASQVESYARQIGLDMAHFRRDRDSRKTLRMVVKDKRQGLKFGVKGTPTLFLNGKMYFGRKDKAEVKDRIAEELHLVNGGR